MQLGHKFGGENILCPESGMLEGFARLVTKQPRVEFINEQVLALDVCDRDRLGRSKNDLLVADLAGAQLRLGLAPLLDLPLHAR